MTKNSFNCNEPCLVEVCGLCNPDDTTDDLSLYPYWKQMHVNERLEIPVQKPDIEQINSVEVSVEIIRASVIRTPRSYDDSTTPPTPQPNLEGKLVSGRKLIIEGQLCQKVMYTADETEQSVHSAHFYVPFSSFIVIPKTINIGGTDVDSLYVNFNVGTCVEDVSVSIKDPRTILKQITLMLNAIPTQGN